MKNLIAEFYRKYMTDERIQHKADMYERALKSPDWEFLRDTLYTLRNEMALDMFSKRFTKLTAEEKDVAQRTYANIYEITGFLLNPVGWIRARNQFVQPNLKGKGKPSHIREAETHGR